MRLISFATCGEHRLGLAVHNRILDLQAAHIALGERKAGAPFMGGARCLAQAQLPASARTFIEAGATAMSAVNNLLTEIENFSEAATTSWGEPVWYASGQVAILPPISDPGKLICIGLNYSDHAKETNMAIPQNPVLFAKFATAIIGPNQPIVHPGVGVTQRLDYEAELAVVIGRCGKNISAAAAMDYVFGYTIMNDVSARDLQMEDGQWLKGKTLDTFAPLGPALVSADEVADPHNLHISLRLNGQTMQDSNTKNLIFKVPQLVSYLSRLMTLMPGDIIATGTPPGVGMARKPPVYMQPGDTVAVEIEGLGILENKVITADY